LGEPWRNKINLLSKDGCIGFHVQALIKLGVTREEFLEMLGMAIYMGGGPSLMYAAEALGAFEEFSRQ
jgi:alkylhydroperoxidase/carboxymuconolactone decarboxylase family protein YurZ